MMFKSSNVKDLTLNFRKKTTCKTFIEIALKWHDVRTSKILINFFNSLISKKEIHDLAIKWYSNDDDDIIKYALLESYMSMYENTVS